MVRFTLKRSLREESCCSLLVVNGGAALRRRSFLSTERTTQSAFSSSGANLFRVFAVRDFDLLFAFAHEPRVECRRLVGGKVRVDGPIFFFLERLDLAFALDDQAKSDGLHASGGQATADFVPQKRGDLISDEAVEHTAGLLRVDQILIDGAWMFEGGLHGALGNFVEGHALNARRSFGSPFLLSAFFFLPPLSSSSNAR